MIQSEQGDFGRNAHNLLVGPVVDDRVVLDRDVVAAARAVLPGLYCFHLLALAVKYQIVHHQPLAIAQIQGVGSRRAKQHRLLSVAADRDRGISSAVQSIEPDAAAVFARLEDNCVSRLQGGDLLPQVRGRGWQFPSYRSGDVGQRHDQKDE